MNGQRLTEQLQLAFTAAEEDVSSPAVRGGAEPVVAKCEPERPAVTNSLMETVCERENLKKALRRVKSNKGSPGVDGMTGHSIGTNCCEARTHRRRSDASRYRSQMVGCAS